MTRPAPHEDVVADAIREGRRRADVSDRDLGPVVEHYAATVASVCDRWALTAVGRFDGGAGMPTLDVVGEDGTAGVLKVAVPGELDAPADVMVAAGGVGYARVLAWDRRSGALLSERLGDDLWSAHTSLAEQARVVGPLLRDAWQVPLPHGKPLEGKAAGLVGILDDLGGRYGAGHTEALRLARAVAGGLAATERPEVVCHGDPHGGNVLARDGGWALVDPDGFAGERAYDLGVVVRDACRELVAAEDAEPGSGVTMLHDTCRSLAAVAGVDEDRVWRWGFVERVTTGLYLAWHGHDDEARTFLDTATLVARRC